MRIAIVGSRDWEDIDVVRNYVNALPQDTSIVSGGARGVDSIAEVSAKLRGLQVTVYRPDWDKFGKRAGYMRNHTIVQAADRIVAFWDGQSKGTKHTIDIARAAGKPVEIVLL